MMKFAKQITILLAGTLMVSCTGQSQETAPAIPQDPEIEKAVARTLKELTLEEKIGQMCQITVCNLADEQASAAADDFIFDENKLDNIIGTYKAGSILNVPLNQAQPVSTWKKVITRIQEESLEHIGIPTVYGADQIHGTTYTEGGTLFPQGINMAATFNRDLVEKTAAVTAYESKACKIHWNFAPVLDLGRDPRWSRMWENYGEDPFVNAEMGKAAVLGLQGNDPNHIGPDKVAACIKHYMGYGTPVSGKDRTPSSISEMDMRERYFAPYQEAVRAGALTVMVNSGVNNGLPFHADKEMLTGWLKEGLNWDGMLVTDWADINNLWLRDHIAATRKEAVKLAINAGIDMSMTPHDTDFCDCLLELVRDGEVSTERIDDAVSRILRLKYRLGLFKDPYCADGTAGVDDYPEFNSKAHEELSYRAAVESEILLKNEADPARSGKPLLPLEENRRILVTGPNANTMRSLNGGWSYSWSGDLADSYAADYHTIYEALAARFGKDKVECEPGVNWSAAPDADWWEEDKPEIGKAVRAAHRADVIVACLGENSYCETPGNLTDLHISDNQRKLMEALAQTGKPIILVLNEGRPRIISAIEPLADAVIDIMLPSNRGGDALAALIAGDENFSGRLPFTYPKHVNSLATYDYKPCENLGQTGGNYNGKEVMEVQWPFGYGLSYTSFRYSDLSVSINGKGSDRDTACFNPGDTLDIRFNVTNTGDRNGKETILLFSSDLVASITPDNKRLRDFTKTDLDPGETTTITFHLPANDLAFVGRDGRWRLEEGEFMLFLRGSGDRWKHGCISGNGKTSVRLYCRTTEIWKNPDRNEGNKRRPVKRK